jgi:predicted kinase
MNHDVADLVDLVADRAKGLGHADRRELAEAIVRRLGFSIAAVEAVVPTPEVASRWEARTRELRVHPMRQAQLPDADWEAFKDDMKTVRDGVLDG